MSYISINNLNNGTTYYSLISYKQNRYLVCGGFTTYAYDNSVVISKIMVKPLLAIDSKEFDEPMADVLSFDWFEPTGELLKLAQTSLGYYEKDLSDFEGEIYNSLEEEED